MRLGFNLNLKNRILGFKLDLFNFKKGTVWAEGIYNRCKDGLYVLYLDYDKIDLDWLLDELVKIQSHFDLGDIHVFQSSETKQGYHVMCFDKFLAVEFQSILQSSSCDEAFKKVPNFITSRNWVLRAWEKGKTDKPKYILTLTRKPVEPREESFAHWKAISLIHPEIKKYPLAYPDGLTKLSTLKYIAHNNTGE